MQKQSDFSKTGATADDSLWRSISTKPSQREKLTTKDRQRLHHLEQSMLAELIRYLEACGAQLAVLSRSGSNIGKYRFDSETPHYTHSGFAVKIEGEWYMDHLINLHASAQGLLVRHALVDFFRDDPYAFRVGVMIPSAALQRQIRETLSSNVRTAVHSTHYSRLSYHFSTRYQNSNQWLAEIIGAAQSGETRRNSIQRYLQKSGLRPSVLRLNPGLQLAASTITINTRLDDHPWNNRLRGRIEFLVEPSLRHYLQKSDPTCQVQHLSIPGGEPVLPRPERAKAACAAEQPELAA